MQYILLFVMATLFTTSETIPPCLPGNCFPQSTVKCCSVCNCTEASCRTFESGCTDVSAVYPGKIETTVTKHISCVHPLLRDYAVFSRSDADVNGAVFMTDKCPRLSGMNDGVSDIITMCEDTKNSSGIAFVLPVSDTRTGLAYRNRFCALCNNVPEERIETWTATVDCKKGLYWPSSYDNIISDIRQSTACDILFHSTSATGHVVRQCVMTKTTECDTGIFATCYFVPSLNESTCLFRFSGMSDECKVINNKNTNTYKNEGSVFVRFTLLLEIPSSEKPSGNPIKTRALPVNRLLCKPGTYRDKYKVTYR